MKYLSCAVVALIGLTAPAAAADLGGSNKDGFDTPVAGASVKWSGFYLGAELGYGKANGDITTHSSRTTPAVPGQAGVPGKPGVAAIPGTPGVAAIPGVPGASRRGGIEVCNVGEPGCKEGKLGTRTVWANGQSQIISCTADVIGCNGAIAGATRAIPAHAQGESCTAGSTTPLSACTYNGVKQSWEWNSADPGKPAVSYTLAAGAVCNYGEVGCSSDARPAVAKHTAGELCYVENDPSCHNGHWDTTVEASPAVQGRTSENDPCVAGREGCIGGSAAVAAVEAIPGVAAVDAIPAIPAIAGVAASVLVQDDYSTISPAGLFGDITLGADFQGSGSNVVFGVFGNYSFGGIDANVGSGHDDITMSIDNQYQLGLRAGYLVTPTTLAYAKVGYSGGELNVTHTGAGEWKNPSLSGYTLGAGVETRLYGGLFARAEYDYTAYGKNDFYAYSDATTTETSSVDLSVHAAKAGLIYKFGAPN